MGDYGNDEYLRQVALSRARRFGEQPNMNERLRKLESLIVRLTFDLTETRQQLALEMADSKLTRQYLNDAQAKIADLQGQEPEIL